MKQIVTIALTFILIGCGPSDAEKQQIAALTCSIMGESKKMNRAFRIKEINVAREKLGEDPFLDGDEAIKEAFKYGLCEQLVQNDPTLRASIRETDERIAKNKALAAEELAAKLKIERKEKEDRISVAQGPWRKLLLEDIGDFRSRIENVNFDAAKESLSIEFLCKGIEGYFRTGFYKLKNNLGTLSQTSVAGGCRGYDDLGVNRFGPEITAQAKCRGSACVQTTVFLGLNEAMLEALSTTKNPKSLIESAHFDLKGYRIPQNNCRGSGCTKTIEASAKKEHLSAENFPPLNWHSNLQNPIRIPISIE